MPGKRRFGSQGDEQETRQKQLRDGLQAAAQRRVGQRQVGGTGGVPGGFAGRRGKTSGGGFSAAVKGGPGMSPLVRARQQNISAKVGEFGGNFKGLPTPGQGGVKIEQKKKS